MFISFYWGFSSFVNTTLLLCIILKVNFFRGSFENFQPLKSKNRWCFKRNRIHESRYLIVPYFQRDFKEIVKPVIRLIGNVPTLCERINLPAANSRSNLIRLNDPRVTLLFPRITLSYCPSKRLGTENRKSERKFLIERFCSRRWNSPRSFFFFKFCRFCLHLCFGYKKMKIQHFVIRHVAE